MSTLPPTPSQTPLFHSLQSDRYSRLEKIKAIESHTGRRLLCWIADDHGQIDSNDIPPFNDLVKDLQPTDDVDLMLRSPGGVIDTAEQILLMLRKRCRGLRVIVPESARSAATLIALGADEIVMGFPSSLGPIDPQVPIRLANGGWDLRPAHSILDGLEHIKDETLKAGGVLPTAYLPMLQYLDPALLDVCRKAIKRSRALAETLLLKYQCAGDAAKASSVATQLEDPNIHLSHGAGIDSEVALALGLNVTELAYDDPLWDSLWRLYIDLFMALRRSSVGQLFESRSVHLLY